MKKMAAANLPDDLLDGILGRLPARSLAASRGVCKAWRDLIDERRLLHRLFLPHSVRGLFINYEKYGRSTYFLSRPTSTSSLEDFGYRRIDGKFDFIDGEGWEGATGVVDHCNGLVLFGELYGRVMHVCNPTTRWSARLPPWTGGGTCSNSPSVLGRRVFLVFDPFVSPEYKVVLSPVEPVRTEPLEDDDDDTWRLMEWPPSAWKVWYVFSSSTGTWEEKVFHREGEAAGTVGDLQLNQWGSHYVEPPCRYAAYWNGALYVHWRGEFVTRLSLLDNKYKVIKSPVQLVECKNDGVQSFLGKSEKGVYITSIPKDALAKLRVWTLSESGGQMEWVPKDQCNLKINNYSRWKEKNKFDERKYWKLDHHGGRKNQDISLVETNVCWNSDDDNIVDVSDEEKDFLPNVKFLGFHPYKEVIFLYSKGYVVAFYLNNPKVQYLGTVHLVGECNLGIRESFVYTPCLVGDY